MSTPIEWQEAGPSVSRRSISDGSRDVTRSLRKRSTTEFSQWSLSRKYAVVVDAGSSGSRMQIYSWKDARVDRAQRERVGENIKVLPTVEKGTWEGSGRDWQLKVEPGLSSFGSHPDDLDEYLDPLFKHASTIIPAAALADTPVYILATAGMRFLPEDQRNEVISKTCKFVEEKTPFSLSRGGCKEHVQVITGEEEGLLGWIAINYLMDGFHFKETSVIENPLEGTKGTKGKSTYGFLDMGGASTQIAFEPSTHAKDKADSDLTPITLRMLDGTDVKHDVFVTTFLGFGTNKARERYIDALVAASDVKPLPDPCLPSGLHLVGENKTSLMGSGSFDTCLSSLSPLLDKGAKCDRPPCLFHGVHVPEIDFSVNHFIGVSEYWFSSNDVFKLGGVYDFVHFQKAAQKFCGRPWSELEAELSSGQVYGPQVSKDRLEMQCFKAAWMTTVLHEGIGLPRIVDSEGAGDGKPHANDAQSKADEKNLFQSVNDVNGLAVSWTLGKAVMEASKEIAPVPIVIDSEKSAKKPEFEPPAEIIEEHKASSNEWTSIKAPSWKHPSPALLKGASEKVGGSALLAVVALTIFVIFACCCLRGRGAKASKRRNAIKEFFKGPCLKKRPRGDYVLANMEEGGHDMDTLASNKAANGGSGGAEFVVSSDTSGDDEIDYPKGSRHKLRRSSGNGLIATLFVPVQKLALAMGFDSSSVIKPSSSSSSLSSLAMSSKNRLISKKRSNLPRIPFRRNFSTPLATSQPSSPSLPLMSSHSVASASIGGAISRPGSRASNRVNSPRLHATIPNGNSNTPLGASSWTATTPSTAEITGGFFTQQASMSASARSSRAASPAFGVTSNGGRTSRNGHMSALTRRAWEE